MSGDGPGDHDVDGIGQGERIDPEALAERIARSTDSVEIKRLVALREVALGRSVEDVADEFGWARGELVAWLDGTSDGTPRTGDGRVVPRPDLDSSLWGKLVIVALLTGLLVAVLQPGLVLGLRAGLVGTYGEVVADPVPASGRVELTIATRDVAYLNRIFEEQQAEVGYCGLVDGDGSLRAWLAQLGSTTASSVQLSASNCPTGRYEQLALLHTHPDGDPRVSTADRSSLTVPGIDYVCIQHGRITAAVGETTSRVRCYVGDDASGGGLRRVPVRVTA